MSVEKKSEMIEAPEGYVRHESAYVDQPAQIGAGTKIWHFSHVMSPCEIGPQCNLGQNVVVSPHVKLGRNVKVQNNVSIYTGVVCEDDVFLGPSAVFTNIKNPRSHVVRRGEYKTTLLCRGATVGANSTIVCGITMGEFALLAAGSVLTKDAPAHALMLGGPARHRGWVCECGEVLTHKLAGTDAPVQHNCPGCQSRYVEQNQRLKKV